MTIRVLHDRLINQIAAGEVVERPASVVKELLENSLDAGASRIQVEITEGGRGSIRVTDNGSGIPAGQMELAFTRHATSKLSSEADLAAILTLGFRGEALPSIASVSRVKMVSSPDGLQGYGLEIEGGRVVAQGIAASPQGTMIEVEDLFFNVPARLKFLKTVVTEALQVYNAVFKLAAAHPEVAFSYQQNDRLLFKTPGNGRLEDAVAAVKGNDYAQGFQFLDVPGEYRVWGMISRPEMKRKNRREEIFFVNRRPVHSPLLLRALDEAYRGRLVTGEFPACYLHLELPPVEVDVNVHPQKSEVRFRDEDRVFRTVAGAVKGALDNANQQAWQPLAPGNTGHYPSYGHQLSGPTLAEHAAALYVPAVLDFIAPTDIVDLPSIPQETAAIPPDFMILGQVFDTYLLVAAADALLLVDQHAADESLRYHELLSSSDLWQPQELLMPVVMEVGKRRVTEFETIQEQLARVGFMAEIIGEDSLILRAVPGIARGREEELFAWLLEDLFTGEVGVEEKEFFREAVASLACHQAIRAGERLDRLTMEVLVKRLISTPEAAHCPHGRPTFIRLPQSKIADWFKR